MSYCIGIGQVFDPCTVQVTPGVNGTEIILFSWDDVNKSATAFGVNGEITAITLNATKKGYVWQAPKDSVKVSVASTNSTMVGSKYAHTLGIVGFGNLQIDYNRYESITKGTTMAFVRQTDGSIDVYGYGVGLVDAGSTWNPIENDATWQINLATATEPPLFESKPLIKYTGTWTSLQTLTI